MRHLPREAALFRDVLGLDAAWQLEHHLLAGIFDMLALVNYKLSGKGEPPKPLTRPGSAPPAKPKRTGPQLDMGAVKAYLEQFLPPPEVTDAY